MNQSVGKLPPGYVRAYRHKAEGCTLFGVPLEELSRDELLAACVHGWEEYTRSVSALHDSSIKWAKTAAEAAKR